MLWVLLAILFVVPLVLFYLLAIRSVDRFAPAPWWLLFLCLMWGAVGAVVPSVAAGMFGQEALDRAFDAELSKAALNYPKILVPRSWRRWWRNRPRLWGCW